MRRIGVGIIGCGNISDAYLKAAPKFPVLDIIGVADINPAAAEAKAASYGVAAMTIDGLLAHPRIEIVLNLTTPQHHVPVGLQAVEHGKHVYSEKPLATTLADAERLVSAAREKGVRVGCAPDTFLGGSHQTARRVVDDGTIGTVVAGSAFMQVPGHELWHPNPDFYYQPGGGPMLDMGPYYLTCLVNLLGPVKSVTGQAKASYATRTVGSGAREGQTVAVELPTHISGLLDFKNGAAISITTSFDVWKHEHNHIELYGTTGSMIVSDPNQFQGDIRTSERKGDWTVAEQVHSYGDGNYRILGLADMAQAIVSGREHRANLGLSLHVLEIMESISRSAETGQRINLKHGCDRPAPMRSDLPFGILE
ncbi:Gfo/Idh/MocA family oxidoreductase [Pararhizobium sp. BT-229]|uniref:Gfo/Idh/MocA family protein n=1 Tax=Pararhizobium sp. BT-229 TaxID=2986923 RepID=UPI0021F7D4DE|nr:Gfo/Idh/MocA family oxidoreductase [Pararhizobium sp. BT-229]MCV9967648.1 Gfo/Idh/MocA family oxidoreductase [Pararhizobium sp. BT-229]